MTVIGIASSAQNESKGTRPALDSLMGRKQSGIWALGPEPSAEFPLLRDGEVLDLLLSRGYRDGRPIDEPQRHRRLFFLCLYEHDTGARMRAIHCAQLFFEWRGVAAGFPASLTADGSARTCAVMALLIVNLDIVQQSLHNRLGPGVVYDLHPSGGPKPAAPQRAAALHAARAATPASSPQPRSGAPSRRPGVAVPSTTPPRPAGSAAPVPSTPSHFPRLCGGKARAGRRRPPSPTYSSRAWFRTPGATAAALPRHRHRPQCFFPLPPGGPLLTRCPFGPAPEAAYASRRSLPHQLARSPRQVPRCCLNRTDSRRVALSAPSCVVRNGPGCRRAGRFFFPWLNEPARPAPAGPRCVQTDRRDGADGSPADRRP